MTGGAGFSPPASSSNSAEREARFSTVPHLRFFRGVFISFRWPAGPCRQTRHPADSAADPARKIRSRTRWRYGLFLLDNTVKKEKTTTYPLSQSLTGLKNLNSVCSAYQAILESPKSRGDQMTRASAFQRLFSLHPMRSGRTFGAVLVCLLTFASGQLLFGQATGSISGTIRDASGAAVPGAKVTVPSRTTPASISFPCSE